MALNFCPWCGTAAKWPPLLPNAPPETSQRCGGCGCELYRNPDIYLLSLAYEDCRGPMSWALSQLYDRETLQEALQRLLPHSRVDATRDAGARLFATVTDLDADRVYLVFHAQVEKLIAHHPPVPLEPWVVGLEKRLREALESHEHAVHDGLVRGGLLELTQQSPE